MKDDQIPGWMKAVPPLDNNFSMEFDNDTRFLERDGKLYAIKQGDMDKDQMSIIDKIRKKTAPPQPKEEPKSVTFIVMLRRKVVAVEDSFDDACQVVLQIINKEEDLQDEDIVVLKSIPLKDILDNIDNL